MSAWPVVSLSATRWQRREQLSRDHGSHARRVLIFGLAVSLFLPGCSYLFVKPAKVDGYPNPSCTASRAAPTIDTILAISNFAALLFYSAQEGSDNRGVMLLGAGMWAGLYTGSASYGFSNTRECVEDGPEEGERTELLDPDYRPPPKKTKKRSGPLVPEPGVMRSN